MIYGSKFFELENIFNEYTNRYDKITMNYDWENDIEMEQINERNALECH